MELALDGAGWRFHPDPLGEGELLDWHSPAHDAQAWTQVAVPIVFDRCAPELAGYEGVGWFRRVFRTIETLGDAPVLCFGAVNNRAKVWLNGECLGGNDDAFLPFTVPIPSGLLLPNADNTLIVTADNTRRVGEIPDKERGWRPYGGILRGIVLRDTPPEPKLAAPHDIAIRDGLLFINNEPTLLLGFNRHDDSPRTDLAADPEQARQDLLRMKEMGANFVRLCHYPHDERTLDLCDEIGLFVMAEIPLYWWKGDKYGAETLANQIAVAKRQLTRLVERDRHHPCIIAWCVSNETDETRPEVVAGNAELVRFVKALDPARLVVHVSDHWTPNAHFDADDVICVNTYPFMRGRGWGNGDPLTAAQTGEWLRAELVKLHAKYPHKPILVTEFGHAAIAGATDGSLGEALQAEILREQLRSILAAGSFMCGATVWCWADHPWAEDKWLNFLHTSPFGVVARNRTTKTAFDVLQSEFRRAKSAPSLFLRRADLLDLPPLDLPDGYILRTARPDDAEGIAAMLGEAFPEMEWTAERVEKWLLNDESVATVFVIDFGGVPVATASARLVPDAYPGSGYVHWVGTSTAHRGKRLGTLVSLAVLYEFVPLGCRDAVLETDDFRVPAIKVYLNLGFVPEYRHATHAPRWAALQDALKGYL